MAGNDKLDKKQSPPGPMFFIQTKVPRDITILPFTE